MSDEKYSHNVEIVHRIEGKPHREKFHLVIPMSMFGHSRGFIEGENPDGSTQGGLVFKDEGQALELKHKLDKYFENNKPSLMKDFLSKVYRTYNHFNLRRKHRTGDESYYQSLKESIVKAFKNEI